MSEPWSGQALVLSSADAQSHRIVRLLTADDRVVAAIAREADAAVVGSALVDIIAEGVKDPAKSGEEIAEAVLARVRSLAEAVRGARRN